MFHCGGFKLLKYRAATVGHAKRVECEQGPERMPTNAGESKRKAALGAPGRQNPQHLFLGSKVTWIGDQDGVVEAFILRLSIHHVMLI